MSVASQPVTAIHINRWPDYGTGPWEIRSSWIWLAGRLECVGVALWNGASPTPGFSPNGGYEPIGDDGPRPVLASEVRSIPLARLLQQAAAELRQHFQADLVTHQYFRELGEAYRPGPTDLTGRPRGEAGLQYERLLARAIESLGEPRPGVGRKRMLGPEELAKVADTYLTAWRQGNPPTQAVAKAFGISASAAAKRVAQARNAGLLAPTSSGRPSGAPELDDDGADGPEA